MHRTYSYKLSGSNTAMGVLGGAGMASFGALGIAEGWSIRRVSVAIEPEYARFLFGILGLIGLAVIVLTVLNLTVGERTIELTDATLSAPRSEMARENTVIPLGAITAVDVKQYEQTHSLEITHPEGKLKLRSPHFESDEAFFDLVNALAAQRSQLVG